MKLPRWLFAEDHSGRRFFVIHARSPRFIAEFGDTDDGYVGEVVEWIDQPTADNPSDLAAMIAWMMREAGEALAAYDSRLEDDLADAERFSDD